MRTRTRLFGASLLLMFAGGVATADDPPFADDPPLMKTGFGDVELHLLAKLAEEGGWPSTTS